MPYIETNANIEELCHEYILALKRGSSEWSW